MGCALCQQRSAVSNAVSKNAVLARCTNCKSSLRASTGMRYPIHIISVNIDYKEIKDWQAQGYEFILE